MHHKLTSCVSQTVLGPWRVLNAGTGSHVEILTLMALVRAVKKWLEEEYWTWLSTNVLEKLGEVQGGVQEN